VQSDKVVPKPLVKTVHLHLYQEFDDNALLYIMRKFPCLSNLALYYSNPKSPMNITSQFLSYVLKLPDLYIPRLYGNNGCQLVAQNFPKSTYLGKNVSLGVAYGHGDPSLLISKNTCNIDPFSIKIYHQVIKSMSELPHLALLEEIGHTLKKLDFSMRKKQTYPKGLVD
jgi:hypothetical protein